MCVNHQKLTDQQAAPVKTHTHETFRREQVVPGISQQGSGCYDVLNL